MHTYVSDRRAGATGGSGNLWFAVFRLTESTYCEHDAVSRTGSPWRGAPRWVAVMSRAPGRFTKAGMLLLLVKDSLGAIKSRATVEPIKTRTQVPTSMNCMLGA